MNRIRAVLDAKETAKFEQISASSQTDKTVSLDSVYAGWSKQVPTTAFELRNLSATFKPGTLTIIYGLTASGKTSLLMCLLKEMHILAGRVCCPTPSTRRLECDPKQRISYCAQNAFLLSASIKENILFGMPLDEIRYQQVVQACCLQQDFAVSVFHK